MMTVSPQLTRLRERLRISRVPERSAAAGDLEVQLALPAWTVFRSTDREYVYGRFPRLSEHYRLHFSGNSDPSCLARSNARYLVARAAGALGLQPASSCYFPGLRSADNVQVVFAYGQFPVDTRADLPIVWEQTFAPQRGVVAAAWTRRMRADFTLGAERAQRIVTATDVSASWFRRVFPGAAHKLSVIPYYLPDVTAIASEALEYKAEVTGPVRVLFVGKEARRKGLDTLVAAWDELAPRIRPHLQITVVSAMLDGAVDLPRGWTHIEYAEDLPALMREAHVLAFPTKREAYGLVLVEALAAGCAVVTSSAEIQRSIVGDAAGLFVDPTDASELAWALTELADDRVLLGSKMLAARARFRSTYEPEHVGERYAQLLWETSGLKADSVTRPR
jgi:glycosyltransferase involved in cell wall biosynthesis